MYVFFKNLGAASGLHHFGNIQSLQYIGKEDESV